MLPHTGDEQQQQEFPAKIDFPLVKIKFSDMLSRFNKEAQINRKVGKKHISGQIFWSRNIKGSPLLHQMPSYFGAQGSPKRKKV